MNARIRELIEKATIRGVEYRPGDDGHPTPTFYFDKEKFAKLIVQECATVASKAENSESELRCMHDVITEHFGVKQ